MELSYDRSQEFLFTLKNTANVLQSSREPWSRTFKCERVNFDVLVDSPIRASASSTGSRGLPSLREEYADFAHLGSNLFCVASIETVNGVDYLLGHLFKLLRRLQSTPSTSTMEEFMQVLGLLEFIGMNDTIDSTATHNFHKLYTRFLFKIGPLSNSAVAVSVTGCAQNIPFHVALSAWHVACKLFNKKPGSPQSINSALSGDDALTVLLEGLAILRRSCNSSIPCSCVQSVLLDLYCHYSSRILELGLCVMRSLTTGVKLSFLEKTNLSATPPATAAEFFEFFTEMISHLIDIRLMPAEEIMSRFILLAGVGELLCEKEPLLTFKVLYSFIKKYQLKDLVKIRKSASKFVSKILQAFENAEIPELEKLCKGDSARWAEQIKSSFSYCAAEELLLIRFLLELLSDRQLGSCSGIIANRYSSAKLLSNDCVLSSVLSLLLAVISSTNEGGVLTAKLCEWITESMNRSDEIQCEMLFNSLDVLAQISTDSEANRVPTVIVKCINALPLPEKSGIFAKRCSVLVRTHPSDFGAVNIERFVSTVSNKELLNLLYFLSDVDVEISGIIWDKAVEILISSRIKDSSLSTFVINQLAVGIQARSTQGLARFKSCLEKLSCVQPDANFFFTFCNGVLGRSKGLHLPIFSQLLPLWIYAVIAFSTSKELDTKGFTSMIWDHVIRILSNIDEHASLELSPGNSEAYVLRFITVLGSNATSMSVREIVVEAVPFSLANQIVALLRNEDKDLQERAIRLCCEILRQIGPILLTIAEEEAPRNGLNRTAFVVITQAIVSKMVRGSLSHDFLLQMVPPCISSLARLPYRMFIYSRIKDLVIKFGVEPAFARQITEELTSAECQMHYLHLTKDSDLRIKKVLQAMQDLIS